MSPIYFKVTVQSQKKGEFNVVEHKECAKGKPFKGKGEIREFEPMGFEKL